MACFYWLFLIIYALDMLFLYFHFIFLFYMLYICYNGNFALNKR